MSSVPIFSYTLIYPSGQGPPIFTGGENVLESEWHQPWALPVRQKISPKLAIALAVSGLFFTPAPPFPETVTESRWHQAWSEPVRLKRGLRAQYHPFAVNDTNTFPTGRGMAWYANFSEPVRVKPGLRAALQRTVSLEVPVVPAPALLLQGWYNWLGLPVRTKAGLRSYLQQTVAYPPRLLPTPNVTLVMNAIETNDVALFALTVYNSAGTVTSGEGARVSITEVTPSGTGPASIRES